MCEPFTFPDGLTLPMGSRISFSARPNQRDPDHFDNSNEFDSFRSVKLTAADARTEDSINR